MAELLYRLGKASAQRAWIVIVAWVAVLGLAGGAFALGAGTLATSFDVPGTASGEVTDALAQKLPDYSGASGQIVLHTEDGEPFSDEQRAEVADLAAGIRDLPDVARAVDPFEAEQERADRQQEITDGRAQLEQGRAQLESGQAQLDAARAERRARVVADEVVLAVDLPRARVALRLEALERGVAPEQRGHVLAHARRREHVGAEPHELAQRLDLVELGRAQRGRAALRAHERAAAGARDEPHDLGAVRVGRELEAAVAGRVGAAVDNLLKSVEIRRSQNKSLSHVLSDLETKFEAHTSELDDCRKRILVLEGSSRSLSGLVGQLLDIVEKTVVLVF